MSKHIKDDILTLFSVLNNYIPYPGMKEGYINLVLEMMDSKKKLTDLFDRLILN